MNVFEDLIIELKQENLLEQTVIDQRPEAGSDTFEIEVTEVPGKSYHSTVEAPVRIESATEHQQTSAAQAHAPEVLSTAADAARQNPPQNLRQRSEREFFKKRAVAEISSLQMVEHVLTGVEREYLKVIPSIFDDFKAKKALNNFVQITDGVDTEAHAAAEFELMHETEAWCSALAERDKNVPVSALRQYCENTKPALSSQALLAIARFYRNLPFSEAVRAKFDFVITRLFSRPVENEKRQCLFNRDETFNHIKTLYADWSSISLYSADDDDSNVMLAALSFDDLAVEAENASNFDQLIHNDFFGRLRVFKQSISEIFFAPTVTASAIEANVRIGNAYVSLIASEHQKLDANSIQSKYGSLNDQVVADATGRTLDLVNILRSPVGPVVDDVGVDTEQPEGGYVRETPAVPQAALTRAVGKVPSAFVGRIRRQVSSISRSVLIFSAVMILGSVGLALWANYFAEPTVSTVGVASIEFENPALREHVLKAKISSGMLYVQLQPTWDALSKEKRQEILQKLYQAGGEKGYKEVNLISKEGKMIGYASATRLDIVMP